MIVCALVCIPSYTTSDRSITSWAIKMTSEWEARDLAKSQGLSFVGRVDPFPDVFELQLSHSTIKTGDIQSAEDAIHTELSGHPAVGWVSKQVPLKRTKREFSDPAFSQQWHLVFFPFLSTIQFNLFHTG